MDGEPALVAKQIGTGLGVKTVANDWKITEGEQLNFELI